LFEEVTDLGYDRSYPTFTRHLRELGLRPHCEPCDGVKGRATIEIEHPPGEEIQWDWVELPKAPWGGTGLLLVGSLPFSGKFRGVFCESMDQPHLVEGIDLVLRRLGGTAKRWRVDRMATVIKPGTADVQASFIPVAKHYSVGVDPCPPRRGNRKGSVEKSIHYLTQRWWRTNPATTRFEAQQGFDAFCVRVADRRPRKVDGVKATVEVFADSEPLMTLPAAPFPATIEVHRKVGQSGLVSFEGNSYSTPHGLIGAQVTCSHRLGADTLRITSAAGVMVASHQLRPAGAGVMIRTAEHSTDLQAVILGQFTTSRPCERKPHLPPSAAARAEAARLVGTPVGFDPVVINLADYAKAVNTGTGVADPSPTDIGGELS
jgi:hypothetical protein